MLVLLIIAGLMILSSAQSTNEHMKKYRVESGDLQEN